MKAGGRFSSLKIKIMLSTLIPVIASFILIFVVIFSTMDAFSKETAEYKFLQTSQKYVFYFEDRLTNALNYLSIVSTLIEKQVAIDGMDRETLRNTVLNIVEEYGLIDGSSIYFEADKFDGMDALYKGTDLGSAKSGKISWYFYRVDDEIMFLPYALEDDIEFELPHYTMAKEANRPIFTDPETYEVEGVNIHMFTLTFPINNKAGEFIGAVTVDIFLDNLFELLRNEQIYESGYIGVYSDRNVIIFSPVYEYIGLTREEAGLIRDLSEFQYNYGFFNSQSLLTGQEALVVINPAYVPQLDSTFYISVTAPLDEIYTEGRSATMRLLFFCIVVVVLIALVVYFLVRRASKPIKEITDNIDKIASGEYSTRIEGEYDGEFIVVKDSVNKMADSIETAVNDLNTALKAAEQSSIAKSEFLSRMSHEMRTPMNAIIGMTDIARGTEDTIQRSAYLDKISDASNHLLNVINDILDMSMIEAGKFELNLADFNFERMIEGVLSATKYFMNNKGHELTVSIDPSIPGTLVGDEKRLAQVITSLLSNAAKFTPEGGEIKCNAKVLSEDEGLLTLQVEIIDNGIGISEDQLINLFSVFEQADGGNTRKYGGTGLGLILSKRIIEMMGGNIWVVSELGSGSKFTFSFKAKKREELEKSKETDPGMSPDFLKNKKALIADDIEINRDIIIAMLEGTGMTFECAENGKEAVEIFKANPGDFDVIFMDMQMPEMDGLEATQMIRMLDVPEAITIPIIALTANVYRDDVIKCLDAGMNNHIGKPVMIDDLFEKLNMYLGE